MSVKSIAFAGFASVASAHILMTSPAPYPLIGGVMNAPLEATGAPFPCGTNSFTGVESTVWEAGSTQNIQLKGTAVHGGGSCQVSVTTDLQPSAGSVWKVIKSIEGGCPARNQAGNIEPGSAELPLPEGYDVEIPDLPSGSYTMAWTWFNKIGNREMYMNCAPIEITGGSGSVDPNSLPDMMVANIPAGNGCSTAEGVDVQFPNPGENVVQFGSGTYGPPSGNCGGSGGDMPPVSGNPITEPKPPVKPPVDPKPPVQPPVDPKPPVQPPVDPKPPVQPPSGGACTEGNWKCIDGSSFSRCASGAWSVVMSVAAGTKCVVGESATLTLA
ncbi:Chitin binding domain [Paramyrothecium foliicola]|nr:Chitin binding domain [Paramyrothecium foliicola]